MPDSLKDRVTRLEGRVENIEALLTRIETACNDHTKRIEKALEAQGDRIDKLASNELAHVEARLKVLESRKNGGGMTD